MLSFIVIILTCTISSFSYGASLTLSKKVLSGDTESFIPHSGKGKWDNYLTMNISYHPVKTLVKNLSKIEKAILKSRGEAHITVITPIEYWKG